MKSRYQNKVNIAGGGYDKWLWIKVIKETKHIFTSLVKSSVRFVSMRLGNLIRDHYCEKRYGIDTSDKSNPEVNAGRKGDALFYEPTPYRQLEKIVQYIKIKPEDVCVDIGCGLGRVVCVFATCEVKKVIGIEVSEEFVRMTKENLAKLKTGKKPLIDIIHIDAKDYNFSEGTIYFLFNPFGYETLKKVIENIANGIKNNPRNIRIIYLNPFYREILDNTHWLVFDGKIEKTDAFVWNSISVCHTVTHEKAE